MTPNEPDMPVTGLALPAEMEFREEWLAALARGPGDVVRRPNLPTAAFAAALLDRKGTVLWRDGRLHDWLSPDAFDGLLESNDRPVSESQVRIAHAADSDGAPLTVIFAPLAAVLQWPVQLPAGDTARAHRAAIAVSLAHLGDELAHAGRAFGMSNLEARLAAALVRHGSVRQAAAQCNVTYETARTGIADAIRKAHCSRQPQLVAKLSALVAQIEPNTEHAERVLADLFGLRPREARLALLLTEGHSRRSAARALGVSEAVAKTLFSRIFEAMGAASAAEASRIVIEAVISAYLTGCSWGELASTSPQREPLRVIFRPDGSQIAVSDFGPREADPVLLIHPGNTTRHPPRSLIHALHRRGYRPIAIDRPGFGLTDLGEPGSSPYADSARDVAMVADALGIARFHIVVRSMACHAHATARLLGRRVGAVVAINADLCAPASVKREGLLGLARATFERHPERIEAMLGWVTSQISTARLRHILPIVFRHSPADAAAMADEATRADYERSLLSLASGRISGYIREQRHYMSAVDVDRLDAADCWTMLVGRTDPLDAPEDVIAYWSGRLPGAEFRVVEDGGRFLHFTHPDLVVDALDAMRQKAGKRPPR